MAVVIETTLGDVTVDLFVDSRPQSCLNFIKLCKMKYYNFNLFHTIQSGFIAQTGDPTGEGSGGESIWGLLHGKEKRYFSAEKMPKIRHSNAGLLSMVCTGESMVGSQFFLTLAHDLDSLDGVHCVIGEVTEGHDILRKLNEVICDENHRPYRDVRITHTVILEDPFNDPPGLKEPSRSPSPSAERLARGRIAPDEEIDETKGKSLEEIREMVAEREAKARATILEIVGDLPDAEIAPPENVLFVCKLNQVTSDEDLEIIFSRFGKIVNCEVIRDKKTDASLQYAFIEFADKKSCEDAYFKMDNVLIDDRRIHVDFSQSVSKVKYLGKGRIKHFNENESEKVERIRKRSRSRDRSNRIDRDHMGNSHISKNRDDRNKHKRSRSKSIHRERPHNEITHRERQHNEKSYRDRSQNEISNKERNHKEKPHNEKSYKERPHNDKSHRDRPHNEISHRERETLQKEKQHEISHRERSEKERQHKEFSHRQIKKENENKKFRSDSPDIQEEHKGKTSRNVEHKRRSPNRNNHDRSRKDSQRDTEDIPQSNFESHNYHSEMSHRQRDQKGADDKYRKEKLKDPQSNEHVHKTKKNYTKEKHHEVNETNNEKNQSNRKRKSPNEEDFNLEKDYAQHNYYEKKSKNMSDTRYLQKEESKNESRQLKNERSNKNHINDTENRRMDKYRETPDLNGSLNDLVDKKVMKRRSNEIETPPKENRSKKVNKIEIKRKKPIEIKKKNKVVKKRKRASTSSDSSSSSSSSTSESSSSSESDHKNKRRRKGKRKRSPSSSSSSTSSSSSSSSESSSDSSSSSSSDNRHKKKRKIIKKKKYTNKKR